MARPPPRLPWLQKPRVVRISLALYRRRVNARLDLDLLHPCLPTLQNGQRKRRGGRRQEMEHDDPATEKGRTMTQRNFTTVIPGWYRTREGRVVEVVQIMDKRLSVDHPAIGLHSTVRASWSLNGDCYYLGREDPLDLITSLGTEKPRETKRVTKTLEYWINVYQDDTGVTFNSRMDANHAASKNRIACVALTGEYEVEEEV